MRPRRLRTAPPPPGTTPGTNGSAAFSLRLESATPDGWRLAGLLIPGLGTGERLRLSRELELALPPQEPLDVEGREAENDAIVTACRARLAGLELPALQQLARIFAASRLPKR